MPKNKDFQHSILIVSSSEQFVTIVKRSLKDFITIETRKTGALGRRAILERYFDIIVIDMMLPDETGEDLALDASEQCSASILVVCPQDRYEDVLEHITDNGILAVPKPFPKGRIDKAIRLLCAVQGRMRELKKRMDSLEEKMEEMRIVSRTKIILIEKKNMTEDEAHRFIGKYAMDNGISRGRAATLIMEDI